MSSGPKTQTSTQKTEPWSAQQPHYKNIFNQAKSLYNSGSLQPKAYDGQAIASQSQDTLSAMDQIRDRSQNATITPAAQDLTTQTLRGDYLDATQNPGFQQALNDAKTAYSTGTAAQTDAAAARSGAFGGSAHKEFVGQNQKAYADSLNRIAGDLYNQERSRQTQALALAPTINAAGYHDSDRLANVGAADEAYRQANIDEDIRNYYINQDVPYNALQRYSGLIGGNLGQTSTLSQPLNRNKASGILGGAASGASIGSAFGPWGALIGGVGGGAIGAAG